MPTIIENTASESSPASVIEEAGGGQKLSLTLQHALSTDKEGLFSVMQEGDKDLIQAAFRNPSLDQQHLLTLLKRRGLGDIPVVLYASKRLIEPYQVKFALVSHPETPAHIVLTLLPLLHLFDLLKLSHMPGVTPDAHLASERILVQRLPSQPLGNKLTLARRGPATVVEALLREGLPLVVEACLDNPYLKEGSLYQFLSSAQANAENISTVARSSRWKSRPNIRLAILKNPRTPLVWFTLFLPGLPPATLRDLLASPRLTCAQKDLVRQAVRRGHS